LSERIPANERVLRQQRIEHDRHGCRRLEVIKLPDAKRGFVLPPRRWSSNDPSVFSAVFLLFPVQRQGVATTFAGVLAVLAPTVGPIVGGWITET
jgi:hypothetical protein